MWAPYRPSFHKLQYMHITVFPTTNDQFVISNIDVHLALLDSIIKDNPAERFLIRDITIRYRKIGYQSIFGTLIVLPWSFRPIDIVKMEVTTPSCLKELNLYLNDIRSVCRQSKQFLIVRFNIFVHSLLIKWWQCIRGDIENVLY